MSLFLFEHVRLAVTDEEAAREYFITGLGGVEGTAPSDELCVNIGASQFILTIGSRCSQWPGHIECWTTEPLEKVQSRMCHMSPSQLVNDAGGSQLLLCDCPFGANRFVLRRAPSGITCDTEGVHEGGLGTLISVTRAVHDVYPGEASALHDFFSRVISAETDLATSSSGGGGGGGGDRCTCTVWFSSGQQLIFAEAEEQPPERPGATNHHPAAVCAIIIGTMSDFRAAHDACEAAGAAGGLLAERSSCPLSADGVVDAQAAEASRLAHGSTAWEEANAACCFRVRPASARGRLEIEFRSVGHPACPLTRKDRVAGGAQVPAAPALLNWPPLQPLPFAQRGIPRSTGAFGEAAVEIASTRRSGKRAAHESVRSTAGAEPAQAEQAQAEQAQAEQAGRGKRRCVEGKT